MFEDIFGDLINEGSDTKTDGIEGCHETDCNGCDGCAAGVSADIPAQAHWDATGDMWSTKSEVFNNDDSPKIWSV